MKQRTTALRYLAGAMLLFAAVSCRRSIQVDQLGIFAESRKAQVLGQDGVAPIVFDDRLTLWTFGDTMLGTWKGDVSANATFSERARVGSMLSNSLAFSESLSPESIPRLKLSFYTERGTVAQFIRLKPDENPSRVRLWALDGIRIGGSIYLYYLNIRIVDPGKPFGFELAGTELARWDVPRGWKAGDPVRFNRLGRLFGAREPAFGGSVIEKDGYLYTVGQFSAGLKSFVRIARVRPADIEKRDAYTFLAPHGTWTRRIEGSLALLGDVAGECTLSYNDSLREYILLYCRQRKGEIALVRFSDFSSLDAPVIERVCSLPPLAPRDGSGSSFYYSGKEIYAQGRTLYAIYINPLDYQPYLLRIKL